ncbi:MAG: hypothetical protein LIP16_01490, partial [Clostridium sp.]|nr:hypothetical protein [Clostridium sp.]
MSRDYENEFGQDEERFRSRSRRRDADAGAGYGADSDTVPSRRQGAPGTENSGLGAEGETRRPAQDSFAGPSDGSRAAGYAGRRGTPGENGTRAAGRRVTAEGVTAEGYAARPGGSRMPGAGSTARSVGGSRTAAGAGSA